MRAKRRGEPWLAIIASRYVSARNRPSDVGHCGGLRRKIKGLMANCPVAARNYFRRHCRSAQGTFSNTCALHDSPCSKNEWTE
jgi:hypothetical protein